MRDEILRIIEENNRKLNPKEIMDLIKENSTVEELRELIHELDLLCRDGILRCSTGNTYIKNDLITGILDVHEKGNAHLLVKGGDDIFIPRDQMKGAMNKDMVAITMTNKEKNEGKVVKVLKRSLGRGIGEVVNDNGHIYIKILDELPYEVIIDEDEKLNLVDGLLVHLDYVKDLGKKKILAKIDYVIGHKNAAGKETQIALIASEFGRRLDFPEEVLEEAKNIRVNLTKEEVEEALKNGRVDLRGETITTIDGKDTKDIDDAINTIVKKNGNYEETTAIADVTDKVKFGSAIWKYAELKGNSDYLGNKVGPMLPIELSNGICSLNPNEDRFSVTVQYELDHSGKIINPNVFLSVIRSKQKMNYDAVQDIIEDKYTDDTKDYVTLKYTVKENETIDDIAFKYAITKEELLKIKTPDGKFIDINKESDFKSGNEVNSPTRSVIKNYYVTSKIMEGALKRRGKIDFDGRERKYEFDENDNVIGIKPRVQREAEKLIENKMIYANEAFAMFMVDKLSKITTDMIPFVFRTHGNPNPKKIEEFLDMLSVFGIVLPFNIDPENVSSKQIADLLEFLRDKSNFTAFSNKLLRCMQKASYTVDNFGHFGIGSKLYCHFTSPIRRMADLLVHTIFKVFVVEKNHDVSTLKFWGNYLNDICEKISMCETDTEKCEYAVEDYLNACYMEDKIGNTYEATIDGLLPSGFFASTNDFVEGRVDFFITEEESKELLSLQTKEEMSAYIEEHKKVFSGFYDYNEKLYGYSRNGKMLLRYGDKVLVCCIGSYPERREIDFALVRKL